MWGQKGEVRGLASCTRPTRLSEPAPPHAGSGGAGPAPSPPPLSTHTSMLYCMLALPMQVRPPPLLPHFQAHLLCCMLALDRPALALPAPLSPTLPCSLAVLYVGTGDVDALAVPVGVEDVLPSGPPVLHRVVHTIFTLPAPLFHTSVSTHSPPPPPYLGMHFSLSVRTLADCSHSLSTNATVSSPDIAPRLTWAGGLGDFYFNLISILRRREEVWITPGEARLP